MNSNYLGKELSACETLIMKAIWDYKEDIPLQKLLDTLRDKYGKEYARTTLATFLNRLIAKDFIETYRKGRVSFTHALKTEEEYKENMIQKEIDFWYGGDVSELLSVICKVRNLSKEDLKKL